MAQVYIQNNVSVVKDTKRGLNVNSEPSGTFYFYSDDVNEAIQINYKNGNETRNLINISAYNAGDIDQSIQDIANTTLPTYTDAITHLTTALESLMAVLV